MADSQAPLQGLQLSEPTGDEPTKARPKRLRVLIPDGEERTELVESILRQVSSWQDERADWIMRRQERYAKLRGWLESRTWSGTEVEASNQHIPIMLANKLRTDAGLYNAVMGIRPMMKSTPTQLKHQLVAERIDHLLDHQLFVDNDGERRIEKFIDQFTGDGTVFSYQPWVKERGKIYDVRTIQAPQTQDGLIMDTFTLDELVKDQIGDQGFETLVSLDDKGQSWTGQYKDDDQNERECSIEVYDHAENDDTDKIDVVFEWDAMLVDGPTMIVMDLEDVVAPMRCENLQPVTAQNPTGALGVATFHKVPLDSIRRLKDQGIYDLLTDEDIDLIVPAAKAPAERQDTAHNDETLKEQKDIQTGLAPNYAGVDEEKQWVTVVQWFGCYDVNGDGLDEDVILWIIKEPKILARARYLTELYPGLPPHRPFAEARFIPIPGQLYAMGMVELMEGLHDMLHVLVNQNIDNGDMANKPIFAYRASSGFKPEVMHLSPGMGFPLDNPQQDLVFPQMPNKDQGWYFNMIGLGMQFMEKLVQISPLQMGQVPQGKASALRTVGTTMAILQQGAAMPEQILRRLLNGLKDVVGQFHMLNTRFLPPKKRFLVTGRPLDSEEAYGVIDDRKDISIPIAFNFQATLLNTNKGMVSQALMGIGQALFSPIMFQMKLVSPEQMYNWARDVVQANQLDPARYIQRPAGVSDLPKLMAEEAIMAILQGQLPTDTQPEEPIEEHFQKLVKYFQSDEFGYMHGGKELLFKQYIQHVQQLLQEQMQQQQLMQHAQQFNTMLGQQAGGGTGGQQGTGEVPPMQPEMGTQQELAGAMQGPGQ